MNKPINVLNVLSSLDEQRLSHRIWNKDYTVWKPSPFEVEDRLGWIDLVTYVKSEVDLITSFAAEIKERYKHVVLLGMGGSILGPLVLSQTFGKRFGYPQLLVLDSTVPDAVNFVTNVIDPNSTLFLVSSKSGTTVETNALYDYFRNLVSNTQQERDEHGSQFVAITDQGTALEKMAYETKFRQIYLNPRDVGGRYSVLSYFGMVPAALSGIDIKKLLASAETMTKRCHPDVAIADNPGIQLGAFIGSLALQGRNKLTLVTSDSVKSFGLWIEQLIAESTGKDGKGIIPIAEEPLLSPHHYGSDRVFAYITMKGDSTSYIDDALERIEASGHPVCRFVLEDYYELGGEFYRWEYATAVAGNVLGINPFNQPNIDQTKETTKEVIHSYRKSKRYLIPRSTGSFPDLFEDLCQKNYLAIMAYLYQTPKVDTILTELRRLIMKRYNIATTLGYGPRFLHSTGQLHKGGPGTGLFLQLTATHQDDQLFSDSAYPNSFEALTYAQALGDLQTLKDLGRKVVSIHFNSTDYSELGELRNHIL